MSAITVIGVDLAKNTFQLHGVDANSKVGLRRKLRRDQVTNMLAPNSDAGTIQLIPKHPGTHERMLKMQLVNAAHERQVGYAHRPRLIVHATATYPDQFDLPLD